MKKILYLFKYFSLVILHFSMISCSVSSISLDLVRPADIDVSNHIQDIVIINRSLPSKGNQAENILDGIFSINCNLFFVKELIFSLRSVL